MLCKRHSEYPKLLLRALSRWNGLAFKLLKNPSHATLLDLFNKPFTEEAVRTNPARKSNQYVCCSFLERALVFWIDPYELLQLPLVTWETMRTKAEKIRSTLVCDAATSPTRSWSAWFSRMGGSRKYRSNMGRNLGGYTCAFAFPA
uniref:AlNc14C134G7045 protein n=1 Tax=Albugo laibachii Nc14 TaxID=890382 RepID=F0WKJ3_9STRA|nr:AlNc14C134G7045 [Albugo laibachii Nc14]|eukprot:CCA21799.1 AlNc14C134G7045 [Albugo laibachii Nc14]